MTCTFVKAYHIFKKESTLTLHVNEVRLRLGRPQIVFSYTWMARGTFENYVKQKNVHPCTNVIDTEGHMTFLAPAL